MDSAQALKGMVRRTLRLGRVSHEVEAIGNVPGRPSLTVAGGARRTEFALVCVSGLVEVKVCRDGHVPGLAQSIEHRHQRHALVAGALGLALESAVWVCVGFGVWGLECRVSG
jgi:hypothetical protein